MIKQPEPSATHKGYDPQINPTDAKDRWNYTLDNMVEKGWLTGRRASRPTYPKVAAEVRPEDACGIGCGIDKPTGKVINYVKRGTASAMGIRRAETAQGERAAYRSPPRSTRRCRRRRRRRPARQARTRR